MLRLVYALVVFLEFGVASLQAQSKIKGINWFPIGPADINGGQTYGAGRVNVSGRATVIAANPLNPNDVWLGTANGGVWHSTNGGMNWKPMSDDQASLAIGALALDDCGAGGCGTIYAGTGENALRRDTYYGNGLMIGGMTGGEFPMFVWTPSGVSQFKQASINNIVLDPTTSGGNKVIYVAVSSGVTASASESTVTGPAPGSGYGIYKTINQGGSWNPLTVPGSGGAKPTDLRMSPSNHNVLYAGFLGKGIFKTTNGGTSWCPLNPGIALPPGCVAATGLPDPTTTTFDFVEIAIFPGNDSTLYASIGSCSNPIADSCGPAIYKSGDGGSTWTLQRVADTSPGFAFGCPRSYSRYTHVFMTHPTDSHTFQHFYPAARRIAEVRAAIFATAPVQLVLVTQQVFLRWVSVCSQVGSASLSVHAGAETAAPRIFGIALAATGLLCPAERIRARRASRSRPGTMLPRTADPIA